MPANGAVSLMFCLMAYSPNGFDAKLVFQTIACVASYVIAGGTAIRFKVTAVTVAEIVCNVCIVVG